MRFPLRDLLTFAAAVATPMVMDMLLPRAEAGFDGIATVLRLPAANAFFSAGVGALLQFPWKGAIIGFVSMAGMFGLAYLLLP